MKCSNTRVYCDTSSGGGGWTVIQRRRDRSINFTDRDWVEYEDGFGNLYGEFWIGLRSMHCLTSQGNWELRIDYHLQNGTKSYLHYCKFAVGSPKNQYPLNISGFNGIGWSDPFSAYNQLLTGMKFTSRDQDNDLGNCAGPLYGGWWYRHCGYMKLNGIHPHFNMYVNREAIHPIFKIRPKNCYI